jgi:hypothetical protein
MRVPYLPKLSEEGSRMIVAYLLAGIAVGLMSALWGWTAGFSVLTIFGFYALGGAMGMAATIVWAAAMCHRSRASRKQISQKQNVPRQRLSSTSGRPSTRGQHR